MNDLVTRYRHAQQAPDDALVTEDMVRRHWQLERQLATELMASAPDERWDVFERCYTALYQELPWLNAYSSREVGAASLADFQDWATVLGPAPLSIYEVGSGGGHLIGHLARLGHRCRGSEITRERGAALTAQSPPNLTWGTTDGVHLDRFEPPGGYDVVLSDQVVEHLHPDDLSEHLESARRILRPGGRYVFGTPHRYDGPSDVSDVFGWSVSGGMHLREYTYGELTRALREAGFTDVRAVVRVPHRLRRVLPAIPARASRLYLLHLRLVETLLGLVPGHTRRRAAARRARLLGFRSILLVAQRP